jgi:hypothetical protein
MKSTEATVFDRKSGAAEGPALRPGSRTKVWVSLVHTDAQTSWELSAVRAGRGSDSPTAHSLSSKVNVQIPRLGLGNNEPQSSGKLRAIVATDLLGVRCAPRPKLKRHKGRSERSGIPFQVVHSM